MELRHLRYFIAVAEELHFARAAERLHIEQSPLSRAIKDLEYDLDVKLFERTTRSTRLTWAGQVFLDDAQRVLFTVEQAKANAKAAAAGFRGTSSIALDKLPGIDPAGYAGLEDGVDWHWGRILSCAALATLLGVNSDLAVSNQGSSNGNVVIALRDSAQDTTNQVGQEITRRNLSVQPTLTVRPGFPMDVMVNKDLLLRPYQPLFFQRGTSQ